MLGALLCSSTSYAQSKLPGFEGLAFSGKAGVNAPLAADIDNNNSNGLEIVIAASNGETHLFGSDGILRWTSKTPNAECARISDEDKSYSSPSLAGDINGDGVSDLVRGYGGFSSGIAENKFCTGGVVAFSGLDGTRLWNLDLGKLARKRKFFSFLPTVFATPVVSDLNADGIPEIIVSSLDHNVYVLRQNGKPWFAYVAGDTIFGSAAAVNADSDPDLEVVVGTDISANSALTPPTKNGGNLYLLDPIKFIKRSKRSRFYMCGFRGACVTWMKPTEQVLQSSPVVADITPHPGLEIAIGSGCYFRSANLPFGRAVKIFSLATGEELRSHSVSPCMPSSPATADLNGDGLAEVVVLEAGDAGLGGDGSSAVIAFDGASGSILWQAALKKSFIWHVEQAVMADLDGNGSVEAIVSDGSRTAIFDGSTGALAADLPAAGSAQVPPVVADINSDGKLDVLSVSNKIAVWSGWDTLLTSPGTSIPSSAPMPMWRGSSYRPGVIQP